MPSPLSRFGVTDLSDLVRDRLREGGERDLDDAGVRDGLLREETGLRVRSRLMLRLFLSVRSLEPMRRRRAGGLLLPRE
jgi:hypothetical protein